MVLRRMRDGRPMGASVILRFAPTRTGVAVDVGVRCLKPIDDRQFSWNGRIEVGCAACFTRLPS